MTRKIQGLNKTAGSRLAKKLEDAAHSFEKLTTDSSADLPEEDNIQLYTPPLDKTERLPVECKLCGDFLGYSSSPISLIEEHFKNEHPGICSCGLPLKGHVRCTLCGIYMGPVGHDEEKWQEEEGLPYCANCYRLLKSYPERFKNFNFEKYFGQQQMKHDGG